MPPKIDLEYLRPLIEASFNRGSSYQVILAEVNQERSSNGEQQISLRKLEKTLSEWSLMRQGSNDLEMYRGMISEAFAEGVKQEHILEYLNQQIENENGNPISLRTLQSRLKDWNLSRHQITVVDDDLIRQIKLYFFNFGISDASILRDLQNLDNITITPWTLYRIRMENGMKRRFRLLEEQRSNDEKGLEFLREEAARSTAILSYGRKSLYTHMRVHGGILFSQNRLYQHYRLAFPEAVAGRRDRKIKQRQNFRCPGPNFLWCLDGYEKLKKFGIQVYACIDAYSRCIIWFYVGRSATTAITTLKQYLRAVRGLQMRPFFTRSDFGIETPLWVAAQGILAEANPATITYQDEEGRIHTYDQGNLLRSYHMYGPSTRNVRIESWWKQLRQGSSDRWIVC